MLSPQQFGGIQSQLEGGGFTVDPQTGADVTKGWSVAGPNHESRAPVSAGPQRLQEYHGAHEANWANGAKFGGWRSGDEGVLDVSWVHKDSPGGFLQAGRNMHRNAQESIYNLGSGKTYWNMSHPNVQPGKSLPAKMASPEGQENAQVHKDWAQERLKRKFPAIHRKVMESGGF